MRGSFVFDQNKCTGCHACRLACTIENGLPFQQSWRQVHTLNPAHLPAVPVVHLSLSCNHCAEPACVTACPALAYSKDDVTGAVLLNQGRCIGCKYCSWACPYDAPMFDDGERVMTKCTFCVERLRGGLGPACAELCPTGALSYAHLAEEEITNDADGFPRSNLGPAIKIIRWSGGRPLDVSSASASRPPDEAAVSHISLRLEWPLLVFTFIVASLFATLAAQVAGGVGVDVPVFLGTAALGMAVSGAHLGRKMRAWRSVLNVAHSWLSREILFVSLFVLCGAVYLAVTPEQKAIGWVSVALGLAALFSVDMVYRVGVRAGPRIPHSANLVLTGPLLAGVLLLDPAFGVLFGAGKFVLYVWRKVSLARAKLPWHPWASVMRLGFGLAGPGVLWVVNAQAFYALVIIGVLLGEFVDRAEFYEELDLASPQRQMRLDLAARIAFSLAGDTRSSTQHVRS